MRKTTRFLSITLAAAMAGGLFLGLAPAASAHIRHAFVVVGPGFYGPVLSILWILPVSAGLHGCELW